MDGYCLVFIGASKYRIMEYDNAQMRRRLDELELRYSRIANAPLNDTHEHLRANLRANRQLIAQFIRRVRAVADQDSNIEAYLRDLEAVNQNIARLEQEEEVNRIHENEVWARRWWRAIKSFVKEIWTKIVAFFRRIFNKILNRVNVIAVEFAELENGLNAERTRRGQIQRLIRSGSNTRDQIILQIRQFQRDRLPQIIQFYEELNELFPA